MHSDRHRQRHEMLPVQQRGQRKVQAGRVARYREGQPGRSRGGGRHRAGYGVERERSLFQHVLRWQPGEDESGLRRVSPYQAVAVEPQIDQAEVDDEHVRRPRHPERSLRDIRAALRRRVRGLVGAAVPVGGIGRVMRAVRVMRIIRIGGAGAVVLIGMRVLAREGRAVPAEPAASAPAPAGSVVAVIAVVVVSAAGMVPQFLPGPRDRGTTCVE
ncbi:hypothetical protein WN71_032900 [Streptomyces mangrovisoli]|uniref:Uncharacterized protein n=1 Tax=Streptomyces mangrovisoli TaxID=1428628 RepID=A0A1J4NMQ4_9ACTN|nr:hypothetical protein WN71_032900 [Streptomyces mangrovisoli]